jgi:large subunit ribosomal protein L10
MPNELKKLVVKEMVSRYRNVNNYLIVGYQGINPLQFNELRKDLRKKKIKLQVVKNSLAVIAFRELGNSGISDLIKGPSAIVISDEDPVVVAKEAIDWLKKIPLLSLRGGFVEGTKLSANDINSLAKLPSLSVLHTQIVNNVNAPIVGVLNAFNAVFRNLANVFQGIKDKKEKNSV